MKDEIKACTWLNEKDPNEWHWAVEYLIKRLPSKLSLFRIIERENFNSLLNLINELNNSAEGVRLVLNLRNNIRQRRYRSASGGRKTCSFTLPSKTKASLKQLAKQHCTTETALIESLIEGAIQEAESQKEKARNDRKFEKVRTNNFKFTKELNDVRFNEMQKHLNRYVEMSSIWEVFFAGEDPDLCAEDKDIAEKLATKKIKEIHSSISAVLARTELLSARAHLKL